MDDVWINYKWMTITLTTKVIPLLVVIRIASYFSAMLSQNNLASGPCQSVLALDHDRQLEYPDLLKSH